MDGHTVDSNRALVPSFLVTFPTSISKQDSPLGSGKIHRCLELWATNIPSPRSMHTSLPPPVASPLVFWELTVQKEPWEKLTTRTWSHL